MIYVAYDYEDSLLRICVADTGKGIKKDDLNKIFKKFGKLKRTANMNADGIW